MGWMSVCLWSHHCVLSCMYYTWLVEKSLNTLTRGGRGDVRSAASVSVGMFGPGRKQVIAEYLLFRWRCEVRRLCLATHHLPPPWRLFTGDPGSASSSRPQSYYTQGFPFLKHCIFLWLHFYQHRFAPHRFPVFANSVHYNLSVKLQICVRLWENSKIRVKNKF